MDSETPQDKISHILNIEPVVQPIIDIVPVPSVPPQSTEEKADISNAESDFDEIRTNLKNLIETATNAVEGLMEVASESDEPRAYEVLSDLIKTAMEANKNLLDIHKKKKDIKTTAPGPALVQKNTINVSSSDLLKMIKEQKKLREENNGL